MQRAKSAATIAMGTKMAAAFPGLQDRLVHLTSALVINPAGAVEAEKLDDEDADAPIPAAVVEAGNVLADEPPELAASEGVLVDNGTGVELVNEPEL
jgi:hypothetical protein